MSITKVPSGHLALFEFSGGIVKNMLCRTVWPPLLGLLCLFLHVIATDYCLRSQSSNLLSLLLKSVVIIIQNIFVTLWIVTR